MNKKIFGGVFLNLIVILFALISLTISGFLVYKEFRLQKNNDRQINYIQSNLDEQTKLNQIINTELRDKIQILESQVSVITKEDNYIIIKKLNDIINMANQALMVFNDVKSSLKLLQYANLLISDNNSLIFTQLKVSINNDIKHLSSIDFIDKVNIVSVLNQMQAQINGLNILPSLIDKAPNNLPENNIYKQSSNFWDKFLNNLIKNLSSLIVITKNPTPIITMPVSEIIIRNSLKLDLLNLKIALFSNDLQSWRLYLIAMRSDLQNYFIINQPILNMLNNIEQLLKLDITNKNLTLDATLDSLVKLNNSLK